MDGDFGLIERFLIDDGQLDGMSPQECFVLGYEMSIVSRLAREAPEGFEVTAHAANQERITLLLEQNERQHTWTWPTDDISESWIYLKVEPKTRLKT